ncbi:MAG: hypothetical protein C5B52_19470 [Bacteroidetes bacterium]|nr:MAG: hypothetical protein C5B52_19470 [Bacteroidota bacterium]
MKEITYTNLYKVISISTAVFFFIPTIILVIKKLWKTQEFAWFASYWFLGGIVNLIDLVGLAETKGGFWINRAYNLFEAPFMLTVLYFTTQNKTIRKALVRVFIIFLSAELLTTFITKLHDVAETALVGVGTVTILTFILWEIVNYLKKIEHSHFEKMMQYVYAGLLFEYGISIITYIFSYISPPPPDKNYTDNYILYDISILITIILASIGFILYRTRPIKIITPPPPRSNKDEEIMFI